MDKKIICKPLDMNYITTAVEMAQENYDLERQSVTALGKMEYKDFYRSRLEELFQNGIGRIAFQEDKPIGFLAFHSNYDIGNGRMGTTSPLYGYGIRHENRVKVIGHLFQATAAELCEKYAQSLRINVYAHDKDILHMYIMSAFFMDTTDVVMDTSTTISYNVNENFTFTEMNKMQLLKYRADVIELYRNLINHLRVSPIFYHCNGFLPIEERFDDFLSDNMRIFAVFHNDELVGMIDTEPTDIGFAKHDPRAIGMGDVFIKTSYRGLGLGVALLSYANNRIRESGIDRVFVTHGTINPTARGFWDQYFTNYAYTMTRQIDPDMLGHIEMV